MDFLKSKQSLPGKKGEVARIAGVQNTHINRYNMVIRMAQEVHSKWLTVQGLTVQRVTIDSKLKLSESVSTTDENPAKVFDKVENPLYLSNNILLEIDNKQNQTKSELKHEQLPLLRPSEMLAAAPTKVEAIMKNHGVPPSVRDEEFKKFDAHLEGRFVKDANHAVNLWNYWCTNYRKKAMDASGQKNSNGAAAQSADVRFKPRGNSAQKFEQSGVKL
jgi:hypothetical protein